MNKNDKNFGKSPGASWILTGLLLGAFVYLFWFYGTENRELVLKHSEFVSLLDAGSVKSVFVDGNSVSGQLKHLVKNKQYFRVDILPRDGLWEKVENAGVEISVNSQDSGSFLLTSIAMLLTLIVGIGIFYLVTFLRGGGGSGGGSGKIFGVGKSKARFYPQGTVGIKFADVAGVNDVKDELKDVVNFLKNPAKFERIGAKIPRGVLLSGDPGNGKTILAKAVAGEANCPFFSISGSDFVEVFVGVGASRVRDLFYQARRNSPCILFIDEIDAVGRQRGVGIGGGNDEREQTLNQLLSEMDGFETEPGQVIVLAATNRVDVLDKALMRPGRFDRIVHIPYPDVTTREKILRIHAKKVKLSADVDLVKIARGTGGFSGAALANLINEAALHASKCERTEVLADDFENARDKILVGAKNSSMIRTQEDLERTAYHESGHALVCLLNPDARPLHKITIVSRGGALGLTWSLPSGDTEKLTEARQRATAMVCLGSIVAEKMIYGHHAHGVHDDLRKANEIIREMVCYYGMSDLGPLYLAPYEEGNGAKFPNLSQRTLEKIDEQVDKIMHECLVSAEKLLQDNRDKLEILTRELLDKETLNAKDACELLGIEYKSQGTMFTHNDA